MPVQENFFYKTKAVFTALSDALGFYQKQNIVVFSHLRWDTTLKRPQHILTKLAKKHRILFVEEPIPFSPVERGTAHIFSPQKNITVLQPKINRKYIKQELPLLLAKQIRSQKIHNPVLWFYSPLFSEIIQFINHSLVVYDCMTDFSLEKDAHITQRKYLLSLADIVFTNGKSLYHEKKKQANTVYCLPDSVDQKHFAKAFHTTTIVPLEMEQLSYPIVGYFGSIDERVDIKLLSHLASTMPDITFVMIGSVSDTIANKLPEIPNLFYLGSKPYDLLPAYIKRIDVLMLPFVVNNLTKLVNSAKILEFMATLKPIVATPIPDIVNDYKDTIRIAQDPFMFVKRIRYYLEESPLLQERRENQFKEILSKNSWDTLVTQMQLIISETVQIKAEKTTHSFSSYYPLVSKLTVGR